MRIFICVVKNFYTLYTYRMDGSSVMPLSFQQKFENSILD